MVSISEGLNNQPALILEAMDAGEYVSFEYGYFKLLREQATVIYCSLQELKEEIKKC